MGSILGGTLLRVHGDFTRDLSASHRETIGIGGPPSNIIKNKFFKCSWMWGREERRIG